MNLMRKPEFNLFKQQILLVNDNKRSDAIKYSINKFGDKYVVVNVQETKFIEAFIKEFYNHGKNKIDLWYIKY